VDVWRQARQRHCAGPLLTNFDITAQMPRNNLNTTSFISAPHPTPLQTLTNGRSQTWSPVLTHAFAHSASSFATALFQMFEHPEHSSSWILRSDTLYDSLTSAATSEILPVTVSVPRFTVVRSLVRRFIPRNPARDPPALQTCVFLSSTSIDCELKELVLLIPHEGDLPYYLPQTAGIGFLLTPTAGNHPFSLSLLYTLLSGTSLTSRLERTALNLLVRATKLSSGHEAGYKQRVFHDLIVSRETFQDAYLRLRATHASRLVDGWREKTDPRKHVFEDCLIAAFLISLWEEMYPGKKGWVGFVDIGCGNGVLVDILLREEWSGRGFDARKRKSWEGFQEETQNALEQRVLVPWVLGGETEEGVHNGLFEEGTFIVSNHADELTPWTPLLAAQSKCPWLAIPCCSHDLGGAKKRFPPPKKLDGATGDLRNVSYSNSTYSSLVSYVEGLAKLVGWEVEREILRIPSTRNVGLLGRRRSAGLPVEEVLSQEGGAAGWKERVDQLRNAESGH
jgi:tRNASer (uridine44-2'-O)-methyltransferase